MQSGEWSPGPSSQSGRSSRHEALLERFIDLAVASGGLVDRLPDTRLGRHIAGQLVRCGTSPAPNYAEACAAESRDDFIHKLGICLKELRETDVWIRIITKGGLLPFEDVMGVHDECFQLSSITGQSVITAKANRPPRRGR